MVKHIYIHFSTQLWSIDWCRADNRVYKQSLFKFAMRFDHHHKTIGLNTQCALPTTDYSIVVGRIKQAYPMGLLLDT